MQLVNKILSDIGMKSYQWHLFFVCGSGWIADNMWLQGVSAVLPKVQQEFALSNELSGLMIMVTMLGMMAGSTIWGYLSDRIGRKPSFSYTLLIAFLFGFSCAFSNSFALLCTFLFAMGSGVGGNLPVDGALFLEFMPPEKQGLLTLLSIFWPVGSVIASLLAWFFIPNYDHGWRFVFGSLGIITLVMVLTRTIFFKLYESPKFLVSMGRIDDAFHVLSLLAKKNDVEIEIGLEEFKNSLECETMAVANDASQSGLMEELEVESLVQQDTESSGYVRSSFSQPKPWSILFSKDYRLTTILIWCIWTLVSFGYSMFNGFLTKYLEVATSSEDDLYKTYLLINIFGIPGSVLVDSRLGRKGTMAIATLGTSVSLYVSTLFSGSGAIVGNCIASFLQNIMWGVIYAYSPEVFLPACRGTAVGIAASLSRIFGSTAPVVAGALFNINPTLPLVVSSVSICLASICMIMLPIETRGLNRS